MTGFGYRQPPSEQSLDEIVEQASTGKVSRRRLIATLTALGVSASAAVTCAGAAQWMHQHQHLHPSGAQQEQQQLQQQYQQQEQFLQQEQQRLQQQQFRQHQQHLEAQTQGANATPNATSTPATLRDPMLQARLDAIVADYHPDAVVHDMLSGGPIQGHDAIRAHKAQEFLSFSTLEFDVTRRYAVQDQVVAEWVARGMLKGEFKGLVGNGSSFEIPGVTLVSRDAQGKIVKEAIYYNLAHVQRSLGTSPV